MPVAITATGRGSEEVGGWGKTWLWPHLEHLYSIARGSKKCASRSSRLGARSGRPGSSMVSGRSSEKSWKLSRICRGSTGTGSGVGGRGY